MHVREQKPRNHTIAIPSFYLSYFKDFECRFLLNLSKLNLDYVFKAKMVERIMKSVKSIKFMFLDLNFSGKT